MVIAKSSLVLLSSLAFRLWQEKSPLSALAETALVWLIVRWDHCGPITYLLASLAFTFIAYIEFRVEYSDYSDNLREQEAFSKKLEQRQSADADAPFHHDDLHGKPMMFPCILRHIRRKAFKDDFQHKYLYIGVPIGLHADYAPLISIDRPSWTSVLSIRAEDQLIRGGIHLTLAQKLKEYVKEQGEDITQWPYAYFLTSPTVFGLSNNPLSYWYLYNSEKKLDAVVMQLDTSYGERRLWLRRNCRDKPAGNGPYCFRAKYNKDLQVSPFMPSEDTGFVLDTSDPCASKDGSIRLMITSTHGNRTLMVTTVTPDGTPLEISSSSTWTRLVWAWRWWLVCTPAGVVWRILSNAYRIFIFNHANIDVGRRVEPIKTVTAKHARTVEKILERYFVRILQVSVESQEEVSRVRYVTPGEHCPRVRVFHGKGSGGHLFPEGPLEITFQVNTPTFYSRFCHYQSPYQALVGELLDDERTRTTWCSDPLRFASLFNNFNEDAPSPDWRWKLLGMLRCPPELKNYEQKEAYQSFSGLSTTDLWVLNNCPTDEQREYRRSAMCVYLGERFGGVVLGPKGAHPELLGISRDGVLRIYEAWAKGAVSVLAVYLSQSFSPQPAAIGLFAVTTVNLWACLKSIF